MRRWTSLATAALALAVLCALQLLSLVRAPAAWSPSLISVTLSPGQSLSLGRQELAAPGAAASHLVLRRDEAGNWLARSADGAPALILRRAEQDLRTDNTELRAGLRFQLGASVFTVASDSGGALAIAAGTHRWSFDGATVIKDGKPQSECPWAGVGARLAGVWNNWTPRFLAVARPLSLGGNLDCGNRIGIEGIRPGAALVAEKQGRFMLAAAGNVPLVLYEPSGPLNLARSEVPLDGVAALTAGRTRMRLAIDGDTLRLYPASHVALFVQPRIDLPEHVSWQWRQRGLWALPALPAWQAALGAAIAILGAALCAWHGAFPGPKGPANAVGAVIALAGLASLAMQRAGLAPGAGISLLLAWAGMWYALFAPRRFQLLVGVAVLLLAAGLLAQLELGLGAVESSWLRHFNKTAALLALGLAAGTAWARTRRRVPVAPSRAESWLLACAAAALAGLVLQVAYGGETGVFDLQPVEFAKLALTVLTAHCLALGADMSQGRTLLRWLRPVAPGVLFAVLLAVALVQVDDYSPLVLLLVWGMSMILAWSLATRQRAATAAVLCAASAAVLCVAGLRSAGAAQLANLDFYTERFQVWLDPAAHPHTGQQLLLGARAILEGGWRGADGLFGLSTMGKAAGEVLRIPAVQDDFAPSFFLNRHGLAAGLALWVLQAVFVIALLQLAMRSWQAAGAARNFRNAWLGRFYCFTLCGGAAFILGHLLLSWGTNLAIFPIMGQPMSFLSAGGSHLLFFICPLLCIGMASAQFSEESQHAGLCST